MLCALALGVPFLVNSHDEWQKKRKTQNYFVSLDDYRFFIDFISMYMQKLFLFFSRSIPWAK